MRILALQGGGIRGLTAAIICEEIERQLGCPIARKFDLVAGTSAGAIVGAGLATGATASQVVDMFRTLGKSIFPYTSYWSPKRWKLFFDYGLLNAPKFSWKPLHDGLDSALKNFSFHVDLMSVSYDITKSRLVVSSSFRPNHRSTDRYLSLMYSNRESFIRSIQASCSAPTYFPAVPLLLTDGDKGALVDGGMIANNPEMIAVSEALDRGASLSDIRVLSIGTGKNTHEISFDKARKMNGVEWIEHIVPELLCANESASSYMACQLLDERYCYLNTDLTSARPSIDDASDVNLAALEADARAYVRSEEFQRKLKAWIEMSEKKTQEISARC